MPAKYVIHTVGPIWLGGNNNERELLKSCYNSSFEFARDYGIKTIAFPAISCGVYRFPIQEACQIAYNTVKDFLKEIDWLEKVIFIDLNDTVIDIYKSLIELSIS